jgi:hypothetical protein
MQSMGFTSFGLRALLVTLACVWASYANGQTICSRPNSIGTVQRLPQDDESQNVNFIRTDLLPYEHAIADDARKPDIISFNRDVLLPSVVATGSEVSVSGADLLIQSVICIRYRLEMLGLVLQSGGRPLPDSLVGVEVVRSGATTLLFGHLQRMEAGEVRRVLLSSSVPLGDAQTLTLKVHLGRRQP